VITARNPIEFEGDFFRPYCSGTHQHESHEKNQNLPAHILFPQHIAPFLIVFGLRIDRRGKRILYIPILGRQVGPIPWVTKRLFNRCF
jgi:hypothetical protein